MTYRDMQQALIEIQCEKIFCYYDYDKSERITISEAQAIDHDIQYIYIEENILYIEIKMEDY